MTTAIVPLKQCSRKEECISPLGSWQPATTEYFRKASKEKSGLTSRCKSCLHKGDAKYREENPDQAKDWYADQKLNNPEGLKEKARAKYQENKDEIIARAVQWKKDNPEKARASSRRSYQIHRDERLAYFKEYNSTYPELVKARCKKYRDTHKEERAAYNSEYDKAHPERARAKSARRRVRIVTNGGNFTRYDILRIFEEQEHRCLYCGITLYLNIPNDMHIDHIKPLSKGGTNAPDNLACACADCNLSKADKLLSDWQLTRGW